VSGHDQAGREEEHLHNFLGDRVQRISQDTLKRHAAFSYGSDDAAEPGLVSTMPPPTWRRRWRWIPQFPSAPGAGPARRWRRRRTYPRLWPHFWNALTKSYLPSGSTPRKRRKSRGARRRGLVRVERPRHPARPREPPPPPSRGIAVTITVRTPQRPQLRNEGRRIRSRRIAQRDDPGELHGLGRTHGHGQNAEALRLQLVRYRGRVGRGLREAGDGRVGAFHDSHRGAGRSTAAASDIFVAESKGVNLASFGKPETLVFEAARRMAASTGSRPPSELARAATARTRASSKPGIGRTAVTSSSLRVNVPVLSAHNTSMLAASSTAERRVGRTFSAPEPARRWPPQG